MYQCDRCEQPSETLARCAMRVRWRMGLAIGGVLQLGNSSIHGEMIDDDVDAELTSAAWAYSRWVLLCSR